MVGNRLYKTAIVRIVLLPYLVHLRNKNHKLKSQNFLEIILLVDLLKIWLQALWHNKFNTIYSWYQDQLLSGKQNWTFVILTICTLRVLSIFAYYSSLIKRVFSHCGIILKPHRSRLSVIKLSSLIFLKCNNLFGISGYSDQWHSRGVRVSRTPHCGRKKIFY